MQFLMVISAGLVLGLLLAYGFFKNQERQLLKHARLEADDLVSDSKERANEKFEAVKEASESSAEEKITQFTQSLSERWGRVEDAREEIQAARAELDEKLASRNSEHQKKLEAVKGEEQRVQKRENKLKKSRESTETLRVQYVDNLEKTHELDKKDLVDQRVAELEKDYVRNTKLRIKADLEWLTDEAEDEAKKIILIALNRFSREYCAERGLSAVPFPSEKSSKAFLNPKFDYLAEIQELCGVDFVIDDRQSSIAVAGYDPVRRELARRILTRLIKDGRVPNKSIKPVYSKVRKDLFQQIQRDGKKIAKELKLSGLNPEITKMMGCLKYRYSFSQNQYFHCSEAGWLCGLLASEIGIDVREARRSGMLHDIGKSMDHSIEGGHAVIGADFIERYGEKESVVHNVRAHHFDVPPSTDTAFLVIGADALSGGRPGARRSTIDSYNQKIFELESIGNSHDGVISTYIVHGGREVRVIANGNKVDDIAAVKLSRKIAAEIEETCNYPGQIKVVVVRESIASEVTQGA